LNCDLLDLIQQCSNAVIFILRDLYLFLWGFSSPYSFGFFQTAMIQTFVATTIAAAILTTFLK